MGAAHMELGANLIWTDGDTEESRRHFQLSRDRTARLPDKERRIVEIDTFVTNSVPVPGDRELQRQTVMRKLDELLARYPQDEYVTYFAGHAHYSFGEWEKALGLFRRSLDIDPGQCHVVGFASVTLNRLGREGENLAMLQRAVEARPNAGNRAMLSKEMAARLPEEASRHAREALRIVRPGQTGVVSNATCALASAGLPEEAVRAVHGIGGNDQWGPARASVQRLLPVLLALQGRPGEAARSFDHARGVQQGNALLSPRASLLAVGRTDHRAPLSVAEIRRGPDFLLKSGELALFGDLHGAAQTAAALTPGSPADTHYRAIRAAVEHRWVDAIPALRPLLDAWKDAPPGGVPDPRWAYRLEARLLLGESLLETGSTSEALEVLQAADRFGLCGVQQAAHVPNILVLRARAHERLGRPADALKDLDRLLALWKNAEPGLPLHAEAKAMRARLAPLAR
jgi:tetratricopeptide (TPR) repeat protein